MGGCNETFSDPEGCPEGSVLQMWDVYDSKQDLGSQEQPTQTRRGRRSNFIARPLGDAGQPVKNRFSQIIGNTVLAEAVRRKAIL